VPAITPRQQALIGKETKPYYPPHTVNEAMAMHWCEMVEDPNPIYFDEAYARTTWLQGTCAPPAMLYTWTRPPLWPPVERQNMVDELAIEGCPLTVAVNAVQEYFLPVRYGDRLSVTSKIAAVSDEKTTRLGTGHFVTTVDTIRNQLDQVVGTHSFTLFVYRRAEGDGA
jgi:acyl dehydratase